MKARLARFALVCVTACPAFAGPPSTPIDRPHENALTFDERVAAQAALERVYYEHQIGAKRPFERALPRARLEREVRKYLEEGALLEERWGIKLTDSMLEQEVARQTARSRMPERLRELRSALGDDPVLIRECLALPALADRLARQRFAYDGTIHEEERARAEALRGALERGDIDPAADHPSRHVAVLSPRGERASAIPPIGSVETIRETADAFIVTVVLDDDPAAPRVANYIVAKLPWEDWLATHGASPDASTSADAAAPPIDVSRTSVTPTLTPRSPSCRFADAWENGRLEAPSKRYAHTAVWTGSYMIVWGGYTENTFLGSGARYDPATDTWTRISSVGAPSPRMGHRAVWTGTSMLVWGGQSGWLTLAHGGGRYDPATDTWAPMSEVGEPSARVDFAAVWTGSELVVWGGWDWYTATDSGGRYDPETDAWTPTSREGAPRPRFKHTAVWTGSRMVIWGGTDGGTSIAAGGLYDPVADAWTPTTTAVPVSGHTAVWTGSVMLVWGGNTNAADGWRYDPAANIWSPISKVNAPHGRFAHSAVWTGSRMIVWGGYVGGYPYDTSTGGAYDPVSDSWTPLPVAGAPDPREQQTAVWTGTEMLVFGGWNEVPHKVFNDGGRFDPSTGSWAPIGHDGHPEAETGGTAVWTGSEMIVWGGIDADGVASSAGSRYDPATDVWRPMSVSAAPAARAGHSAVWAGGRMIVWGGFYWAGGSRPVFPVDTGVYDPIADRWLPSSAVSPLEGRRGQVAVSTGDRMIVWGGFTFSLDSHLHDSGAIYDPATDSWISMGTAGAPAPRQLAAGVWTGSELVVWGGFCAAGACGGGARYDPEAGVWRPMSSDGAPSARFYQSAVWSGREMIVWGGSDDRNQALGDGARYDPASDTWSELSMDGAPAPRFYNAAVWADHEMIVWGGNAIDEVNGVREYSRIGGRYDPALDRWTPTTAQNAPSGRISPLGVWTGTHMIVWGGAGGDPSSGGQYRACRPNAPPTAIVSGNLVVECTANGRGDAQLDGSASSDPDSTPGTNDDIVSYEWISDYGLPAETTLATGVRATVSLPLGTHAVTLRVTDRAGAQDTATFDVAVRDTIPPVLTLVATPDVLWPPDHRWVDVHADAAAVDACGPAVVSLESVTSSEPADAPGSGDGETPVDIEGADVGTADFDVALRAERAGAGTGRVYTLVYVAVDASGNASRGSATVTVPHDRSDGIDAVARAANGSGSTGPR